MEKGFTHIYTGNGKGKTTAAIGLAIRAAGYGLKTCFIQFMKDFPYNEKMILSALKEQITLFHYGNDAFVFAKKPPSDEDIKAFRNGFNKALDIMSNQQHDLLILDEIFVCLYFDLCNEDDILTLIAEKPEGMELVLTGRYCPEHFYTYADLVTEMKEIKHYYQKGVLSRNGIDC